MAATQAAPPHFEVLPIPQTELLQRSRVRFLHPGYPMGTNILLTLPRVDPVVVGDTTTAFGVHYGTALIACQIIAGNVFNTGRVTLDAAGIRPVDVSFDSILTEEVYYFVIDGGPDPYPIVPSFQDWEFPHSRVPYPWSSAQPQMSSNLPSRCMITNFSIVLEDAHLVPKEQVRWYNNNAMDQYGSGVGDIDNSNNLVPLRADMHKCFDKPWLTFVPKVASANTRVALSPQLVTYILMDDAAELWPTYHNVLIPSLGPYSSMYLFAHFAWAILLRVKPFITRGFSRHVIRAQVNNEGKMEHTTEVLSGSQLTALYSGGGSKAATPQSTPRKRNRGSAEEEDNESSGEETDFVMDDVWGEIDDLGEARKWGNRTQRQKSSETTANTGDNEVFSELEACLEEVLPQHKEKITEVNKEIVSK